MRGGLVPAEGSILEGVDVGQETADLEKWAGWEPQGGWQTAAGMGRTEEARVERAQELKEMRPKCVWNGLVGLFRHNFWNNHPPKT